MVEFSAFTLLFESILLESALTDRFFIANLLLLWIPWGLVKPMGWDGRECLRIFMPAGTEATC